MRYSTRPALEYVLLILLTPGIAASEQTVYFTMDSYTMSIPHDFPDNESIAQVYTRTSPNNWTLREVVLDIRTLHEAINGAQQGYVRNSEEEAQQFFDIEQETGLIYLQQPVGTRGNITGWNFTLQISAWTQRDRPQRVTEPSAVAILRVEITAMPPPCSCFKDDGYVFRLRSDAQDGAFGTLASDPQCMSANGASLKYSLLSERNTEWIHIDNQTSELVLIRHPTTSLQSRNVTVECTMETSLGGINQTRTESTLILIRVQPVPDYIISVKKNRSKGDRITWIHTNDPAVMKWRTISVSLSAKHLDFYSFNATAETSPVASHSIGKVIGEIIVLGTLPWCLEDSHTLIVYLRDGEKSDSRVFKMIVQVDIHALRNKTSTVLNLTVHRSASLYSRVATFDVPSCIPSVVDSTDIATVLSPAAGLIRLESTSMFAYIGDTTPLENSSLANYSAVVRRRVEWDGGGFIMVWLLQIGIVGEHDVHTSCDGGTCSEHNFREGCENGCGLGTPDGRCKWREQISPSSKAATDYSTCSPDFDTCPNRECDSLERQNPRLCPQDCIDTQGSAHVVFMELDPNSGGIIRGVGPCWCEKTGLRCMCGRNYVEAPRQTDQPNTVGLAPYSHQMTVNPSHMVSQDVFQCANCNTLIPVVLFLLLFSLGIGVYIGFSRRLPFCWFFSGRNYKPPVVIDSSDSRLNSVLSECSDDGLHLNKGSMTRLKTEFDPKWEFSRRNLVLDKVLGEGEFGRVVRAQALSIRSHAGYTTVAVKMLKGSYSSNDLQDLITEMNLLKDLNHPNIVRLLGASTQKGPLYVIVEYCRHGCLRDFLRQNRQTTPYQDDGCLLQDYDKAHSEDGKTKIAWNNRDLLSFAWQICKGMQYLAMLKLVHRDLAARNILVSEGMVIKVSDFGLARDLYESGTYVKTSKSRIPMKWMAPESLFDNIYTTKTDIWSFGVLFWEIVTMGAMPYPGISSHKLCQLIRQGRRLERPEGCAEELYSLMHQCWQSDPNDRPDFDMVGVMLEQIMMKDADYLDLSCSPFGDCSDEEELNSRHVDEQTSSVTPLLHMLTSESTEFQHFTVSLTKDHHEMSSEFNLKEIITEETNLDAGPLYGDMDPCRLYSNVNNNFISDHLCKTVSEPNLSSSSIFHE